MAKTGSMCRYLQVVNRTDVDNRQLEIARVRIEWPVYSLFAFRKYVQTIRI